VISRFTCVAKNRNRTAVAKAMPIQQSDPFVWRYCEGLHDRAFRIWRSVLRLELDERRRPLLKRTNKSFRVDANPLGSRVAPM